MPTSRRDAKEQRRKELLAAAARIMAEKGFHQTRLADVGAAVGISGPGLYRHFSSKNDLLAKVLIDVSIRLVDGAREELTMDRDATPRARLEALVRRHAEFAATEPDLIRVQEREISNLSDDMRDKVRSLQRTYLRMWTDILVECKPGLDRSEARLRVQLVAGLINSSRHVIHWAGPELVRTQSEEMANAALLA